ncbi:MAG: hypothetical protein ABL919_00670 [Methylococcales bacterium]|nr:hypothetical protein [Methylococcaceae bacterium]
MKFHNPLSLALSIALFSSSSYVQPAFAAATPAAQDNLRIHTSAPKKASDSLFASAVEWRIDDNELYRSNGISFLNSTVTDGATAAKKLTTGLIDGMIELYPSWRGITVNHAKDKPELTIANKAGFSITTITIKDYTNQNLSYDLVDKSFSTEGVQIGIDLVYAADVEYLEGFSTKKAQTASQGTIKVQIEGQPPVEIKTDGKTTHELEVELAKQLATSHLSEIPLFPVLIGGDTRNNKSFDAGEVQLLNLAAKSIAIDVSDPSLGVITKFKFKDENATIKVLNPMSMLLIALGLGILAGGYFWYQGRHKKA